MKLFDALLGRFGYVRLESYGLELARSGRIRSAYRVLHDDGGDGPIVGWRTEDDSVHSLATWSAQPSLPPPAQDQDEWDLVVTRAQARIAAMQVPEPVEPPPPPSPRPIRRTLPPPRPIPHLPR